MQPSVCKECPGLKASRQRLEMKLETELCTLLVAPHFFKDKDLNARAATRNSWRRSGGYPSIQVHTYPENTCHFTDIAHSQTTC